MHEGLERKIRQMMPLLNEKQLRCYLGSEAEALGYGGIAAISGISGKSRNTVVAGMREHSGAGGSANRIRRGGGGRKTVKEKYPGITAEVEKTVRDSTYGNPENPLTYTAKSTGKIKQLLNEKGMKPAIMSWAIFRRGRDTACN